jgi:hypothetical protein
MRTVVSVSNHYIYMYIFISKRQNKNKIGQVVLKTYRVSILLTMKLFTEYSEDKPVINDRNNIVLVLRPTST